MTRSAGNSDGVHHRYHSTVTSTLRQRAPQAIGLVLAGGRGRRVDGADKGLLRYRGHPLAAYAVATLAPSCDRVLVSANRNIERYARLADGVCMDASADHLGPLAGILTGMSSIDARWFLTCPTDMPELPAAIPLRLLRALRANAGADVMLWHDGERSQPLISAWRGALAPSIAQYLAGGGRSVVGYLATRRQVAVRVAAIHTPVANMNSRPDAAFGFSSGAG